jgi:hypothetical protein
VRAAGARRLESGDNVRFVCEARGSAAHNASLASGARQTERVEAFLLRATTKSAFSAIRSEHETKLDVAADLQEEMR